MAKRKDKGTGPEDAGDYEVGYGRPPVASRFKPGTSGNSKGRPRAPKSFAEALEKQLSTKVAVSENGRRKLMQIREIIAGKLVRKAAEGDHQASALLLKAMPGGSGSSPPGDLDPVGDPGAQERLLRKIAASMGGSVDALLNLPAEVDDDEA